MDIKHTPTPWVYILSENYPDHQLYTVGFYRPDGKWEPESDHGSAEEAAERAHYLNGGACNAHEELLWAANEMLGRYERDMAEYNDDLDPEAVKLHARVKAAIAKAEDK